MFPIFHYKSIKLLKKFEEINYYYYYYYYSVLSCAISLRSKSGLSLPLTQYLTAHINAKQARLNAGLAFPASELV